MNDAKIPDLSSPGRLTARVRVGAALLLALAPMLALAQRPAPEQSLPESETLRRMGGRLSESAAALGLTPRTLAQRLREHRISLDDGEDAPPPVMP